MYSKKWILSFVLIALVSGLFYFIFLRYLNLDTFNHYRKEFLQISKDHHILTMISLFCAYVLMSTVSLPGTLLLSLLSGFLYGFVQGVFLHACAITLGSTISFLICRSWLRDFFRKKYAYRLKDILSDLNQYGVYYLFAMRMTLIVPLFLPNTVMGLTSMKMKHFVIISFLGFLPEIMIYANAGKHVLRAEEIQHLFSLEILVSFLLIGLFPLITKKLVHVLNQKKSKESNETEIQNSGQPV